MVYNDRGRAILYLPAVKDHRGAYSFDRSRGISSSYLETAMITLTPDVMIVRVVLPADVQLDRMAACLTAEMQDEFEKPTGCSLHSIFSGVSQRLLRRRTTSGRNIHEFRLDVSGRPHVVVA